MNRKGAKGAKTIAIQRRGAEAQSHRIIELAVRGFEGVRLTWMRCRSRKAVFNAKAQRRKGAKAPKFRWLDTSLL